MKTTEKKNAFPRQLLWCLFMPAYLELLLHLFVYGGFSGRIVYPLLFALAAGLGLFVLCSLFPRRVNRIVAIVLTTVLTLYFEIQFVYNSIFGEFMSVWQVSFGTTAIANFYQAMLYGILHVIPQILALLLPIPGVILLSRPKWGLIPFERCFFLYPLLAAVLCLGVHFGTVSLIRSQDDGAFSVWRLYSDANTATEISIKNIGLLSTTRQECKFLIQGARNEAPAPIEYPDAPALSLEDINPDEFNMLNIDFTELAAETENTTLSRLDRHFASVMPTQKNEYTGLCEGYNLITICAESYSPYLIDKERTPALYRLSHEGLIFDNYFGTYGSNTTNGEYTFCVGLYPDLSRSKSTASFYASQKNFLPFCLGNMMKAQGAEAYAYHNYTGEYYSRNVTHPNMGYTFRSATDGLDIEISWPSSDLEMMQQSVKDYINADRFCAYYMTFSGHYQYNWDNPMSAKHRAVTEGLPFSETVKAYIACNMELEYALEYLTDELDKAGKLENTVIVLTNDHYPYGLEEAQYNELAGKEVDPVFDKYRSSFICWVPGIRRPVDTYCSTIDILPTLLNLFALPYDSRLLPGKDVLSPEASGVAVLSDRSFITKDYAFDASTGAVVRKTDAEVTDLEKQQDKIALDMQLSTDILDNDYYAHAILGVKEVAADLEEYAFTDIPETFSLGILDYLYKSGYMDPISETKFGFDVPCAYAELLDTLFRMEGLPPVYGAPWFGEGSSTRVMTGKYAPAVRWAQDKKILGFNKPIDSFSPLTRSGACLTLFRYAKLLGCDTTVDQEQVQYWLKKYPDLSWERVAAMLWCFEHSVARMDGSLDSVFRERHQKMTRYYAMTMLYNFHLAFENDQ